MRTSMRRGLCALALTGGQGPGAGTGDQGNGAGTGDPGDGDSVAGAMGDRAAGVSRSGTRDVAGLSAAAPRDATAGVLPSTGSPVGAAVLGGALLLLLVGLALMARSRREELA